jgi:anthranilate synthase/aminodeoxychorismate synthase-like glutamine amidotransferase
MPLALRRRDRDADPHPREAGICPLVRAAAGGTLLGVCLGHQSIGEAFGGRVVRADRLMHGKTTMVAHTHHALFRGLPSPFEVMRYHSLVVAPGGLPEELEVTAWSDDRPAGSEIMALCHRELPIFGVQFHLESVATREGNGCWRTSSPWLLKPFLPSG